MNDKKGICPTGWHIPTNDEWKILSKNLNSYTLAKENVGWWSYKFNGQDYLPIDYREKNGKFLNENSLVKTNYGGWWTSTEIDKKTAWKSYVGFSSYSMIINTSDKNSGYSILCLKNKGT